MDAKVTAPPPSALDPLTKVGIRTPGAALAWVPRKHVDYRAVPPAVWPTRMGEKVCVELRIATAPISDPNQPKFKCTALDASGGRHELTVFGALRFSPWNHVKVGETVRVRAKLGEFRHQVQLGFPELVPRRYWDKIVPVYRGVPGRIAAERVAEALAEAIQDETAIEDAILDVRQAYDGRPAEDIMQTVGESRGLAQLFRGLHAPVSPAHGRWALATARKLAVAQIRHRAAVVSQRPFNRESVIRLSQALLEELLAALPFQPTQGEKSQASAIQEIVEAMAAPTAMDAVLSADVGVGKTLCYMIPSIGSQRMGKKVAILIPNGLLVDQVAKEFRALFPDTPVAVVVDKVKAKHIDWASNPVLIGTTALLKVARDAGGWVPDLLIVDEQQKTSLEQRSSLMAPHTNLLECTATALPRTLALLTHGGKQLIQVAVRHAVQTLHTTVVGSEHRKDMMRKIHAVLAAGGQVALIYPRVKGTSEGDRKSVEAAGQLWERQLPGQVAVLHGKMKDEQKTQVMAAVKAGEKRVLISSSIIEIGVTIADLKLLVVVHAERYGVSTLHQMRGRLVRHGGEGWCLLYTPEAVEPETMDRLKLMEQTTNGFRLAELDMEQRGFGDLSDESSDQSGASGTLFRDLRLMPSDFV